MTAFEIAGRLIELWINSTRNTPINRCRARLQFIIAGALDKVSQDAYHRGFRDAGDEMDASDGHILVKYAEQSGAQGTWLIRGATNFDLLFNLPGDGLPIMLNLEDAPLIFVARFPIANGGEPGIEHR